MSYPRTAEGRARNVEYGKVWKARHPEKAKAHRDRMNAKRTPTYRSWEAMKRRCANPNDVKYESYGGRGITVCARWLTFDNFLADMGERPEGRTLDRIDNEGNYEPGNCRWATPSDQNRNQRARKGN